MTVPISPRGRKYFVEDTAVLPKLLDFIHATYELDDRKPLLVGVSGGGSAALAIAAQSPALYAGAASYTQLTLPTQSTVWISLISSSV